MNSGSTLDIRVACVCGNICLAHLTDAKPVHTTCRLECIQLQHDLHKELGVIRFDRYVDDALHSAELEAQQQVSSRADVLTAHPKPSFSAVPIGL